MDAARDNKAANAGCTGQCDHCESAPAESTAKLTGWPLAAAAIGVFLLPLAAALLGGLLAGAVYADTQIGRSAGTAAGLAIGLVAAALTARLAMRVSRETT